MEKRNIIRDLVLFAPCNWFRRFYWTCQIEKSRGSRIWCLESLKSITGRLCITQITAHILTCTHKESVMPATFQLIKTKTAGLWVYKLKVYTLTLRVNDPLSTAMYRTQITMEPLTTDSPLLQKPPQCGQRQRSQIIPYSLLYIIPLRVFST